MTILNILCHTFFLLVTLHNKHYKVFYSFLCIKFKTISAHQTQRLISQIRDKKKAHTNFMQLSTISVFSNSLLDFYLHITLSLYTWATRCRIIFFFLSKQKASEIVNQFPTSRGSSIFLFFYFISFVEFSWKLYSIRANINQRTMNILLKHFLFFVNILINSQISEI